jgi:hypothetical protein
MDLAVYTAGFAVYIALGACRPTSADLFSSSAIAGCITNDPSGICSTSRLGFFGTTVRVAFIGRHGLENNRSRQVRGTS